MQIAFKSTGHYEIPQAYSYLAHSCIGLTLLFLCHVTYKYEILVIISGASYRIPLQLLFLAMNLLTPRLQLQ
jgi:hypothetical protein